MAIKQEITSVSGVKTEYHRISEAYLNYTQRRATIIVLSYLEAEKRDEEKAQASIDEELKTKNAELEELVKAYDKPTDTPELYDRRVKLSNEVTALQNRTPEDVAPRNIFNEQYTLDLPTDAEFTLEFAYNWLKNNIYKNSEDC